MSAGPFTILLCEGYHDRSFLAGALLTRLGWSDPGERHGQRVEVNDLWGKVAGGDFGFTHPGLGAQLRLRPCHGHSKLPTVVRSILAGRETKHFDRLILNYDGDKGGSGKDFQDRIHQSVEDLLVHNGASPAPLGIGRWSIDDGLREVSAIVWSADGPARPGVPVEQCLERLICSSAAEVWPERLTSLGDWLAGRPDPRSSISSADRAGTIPKSFSWALMGGWFAEHGCDDFFKELWTHEELSQALQRRLVANGAWDRLLACARPVSG